MQNRSPFIFYLALLLLQTSLTFGQKNEPTTGPVFNDVGAVFSIADLDFLPDTSKDLKAIFDIDRKQKDPSTSNPIISSLHRYYNMHVRYGVPKDKIHLALVLHGSSTKDALSPTVYKEKYNTDNPNRNLIKTLSEIGVDVYLCGHNTDNPNRNLIKTLSEISVDVYLCGQSMSSMGYSKEDLLPEVKVALSAMTVLTAYQMNNYALIKF